MDAPTFLADFPEFNDPTRYTSTAVARYLTLSVQFLDPVRWGANLDYGTELFIAHHLVLDAQNRLSAIVGGVPGTVKGPETAKSVDKVSVSRDPGAVTLEGAGMWNTTSYGIRFWQLAGMMGAGGIQL